MVNVASAFLICAGLLASATAMQLVIDHNEQGEIALDVSIPEKTFQDMALKVWKKVGNDQFENVNIFPVKLALHENIKKICEDPTQLKSAWILDGDTKIQLKANMKLMLRLNFESSDSEAFHSLRKIPGSVVVVSDGDNSAVRARVPLTIGQTQLEFSNYDPYPFAAIRSTDVPSGEVSFDDAGTNYKYTLNAGPSTGYVQPIELTRGELFGIFEII